MGRRDTRRPPRRTVCLEISIFECGRAHCEVSAGDVWWVKCGRAHCNMHFRMHRPRATYAFPRLTRLAACVRVCTARWTNPFSNAGATGAGVPPARDDYQQGVAAPVDLCIPEAAWFRRAFRKRNRRESYRAALRLTPHSHAGYQSAHAHENPQRGATRQPHNNDACPDAALAEAEGAHTDQKSHMRNPVAAFELGIQVRYATNDPDRKV